MGLSFSSNSPNTEISISVKVNSLAQVQFEDTDDLKHYLSNPLKQSFDQLSNALLSNDYKSTIIKEIVSNIYSNYGETVSIGFFIGCYEININHNNIMNIESGGKCAFSSNQAGSRGINFGGLNLSKSASKENSNSSFRYANINNISANQTVVSYGSSTHPATFMFDIVDNTRFGSSFVPLSQFAPTKSVKDALDYWAKRWRILPTTLSEYKFVNDIQSIPLGSTVTLYRDGMPYDLFINDDGQIILPGSKIIYHYYKEFHDKVEANSNKELPVVYDIEYGTIGGFTEKLFSYAWKKKIKWRKRGHGFEHRTVTVSLGPHWKLDEDITEAYFTGNGLNYITVRNIDTNTFSVDFSALPTDNKSGKNWEVGPVYLELQQRIKIRLA